MIQSPGRGSIGEDEDEDEDRAIQEIHPIEGLRLLRGRLRAAHTLCRWHDASGAAQAGGYFITVVAFGRQCLFGEITCGEVHLNPLGRIVTACWNAIPEHFPQTEVDAFVVMPNHINGIVFLAGAMVGATYTSPLPQPDHPRGPTSGSLGMIVGTFKAAVTRRAGVELNAANIWQRNYYEHIIRDQAEYERIAAYILGNPSTWEQDEERPR